PLPGPNTPPVTILVSPPPANHAPDPTPLARVTPDAPFRKQPPSLAESATFTPPGVRSFRLRNGVRVMLLEQHMPQIVTFEVALKASGARTRPGARALMVKSLREGTSKHADSHEVGAALDAEMTDYDAWATANGTFVRATTVSNHAEGAL